MWTVRLPESHHYTTLETRRLETHEDSETGGQRWDDTGDPPPTGNTRCGHPREPEVEGHPVRPLSGIDLYSPPSEPERGTGRSDDDGVLRTGRE